MTSRMHVFAPYPTIYRIDFVHKYASPKWLINVLKVVKSIELKSGTELAISKELGICWYYK